MKSNAKILTNQLINLAVKQFDALLTLNVLNLTEKQNVFASMDMNSMMLELVSVAMIGAKERFQINVSWPKGFRLRLSSYPRPLECWRRILEANCVDDKFGMLMKSHQHTLFAKNIKKIHQNQVIHITVTEFSLKYKF